MVRAPKHFNSPYAIPNTYEEPVWPAIVGVIFVFVFALGCIGMIAEDSSYDDSSSYSSGSSSGSSGSSSNCYNGGADDRWCYDLSSGKCIYHVTATGNIYIKDGAWYGC